MNSDHPRSRGEYLGKGLYEVGSVGSSPLSRGILGGFGASRICGGIIPALAGNTSPEGKHDPVGGDHPRSRGEYRLCRRVQDLRNGSSPLSRGILEEGRQLVGLDGIIPALAGNTVPRYMRRTRIEDHPRSRGEYVVVVTAERVAPGSSPLSRGIPSGVCPLQR